MTSPPSLLSSSSLSSSSLWRDTVPHDEPALIGARAPLPSEADVVIVGGGLTGLWTAFHLLQRDRALRVVVLERDTVGFGASGRNGGWCSALLPMSLPAMAAAHGNGAARRMQHAMHTTIDEIGGCVAEWFPTGAADVFHRGGTVDLARGRPQAARLHHEIEVYQRFGFGDDDYRWLDATEASAMCTATNVVGAMYTPRCATVHPLRLTNALARAVEAMGGAVHERTTAQHIATRRVVTDRGPIRSDIVVRATEGYTASLPAERRSLLPIYSMMIATEPLSHDVWDQIGLVERPTFADGRHMIIYGQRTADDRFAFGGRGAPYHFGSRIDPSFDTDARVRALLTNALSELFPAVADAEITHHWGGVLGVPRDWQCFARFDRTTGFATAGGYVGDGVATTHLAGRTLAALITDSDDDHDRELVRLPWVGHRSRRWEPEPLRWIGVNAGRLAAGRADSVEQRTGRASRFWAPVVDLLLGR